MSKVYFADTSAKNKTSLIDKTEKLIVKAGLKDIISENELVAIKIHFGERGNTAFVPSFYVRRIVDLVKGLGGKPFVTDANTLYKGSRANAVDHMQTAYENGFAYSTIAAPVVIADGLDGKDFREVEIDGEHFDKVKIASAVLSADSVIAVSHFKGHEMTGFGGALKNVGMGLGSRGAKQMMHSGAKPEVIDEKCIACRKCVSWCPTEAITIGDVAKIDQQKCYSCGECTVTCPHWAITIKWETTPADIQEKIVEHVKGALAGKMDKKIFVNYLLNITPDCDCWGWSDKALIKDIGILASKDPVAIDAASLDLVNEAAGKEVFKEIWSNTDPAAQIAYAQKMGLGSSKYELEKLNL